MEEEKVSLSIFKETGDMFYFFINLMKSCGVKIDDPNKVEYLRITPQSPTVTMVKVGYGFCDGESETYQVELHRNKCPNV